MIKQQWAFKHSARSCGKRPIVSKRKKISLMKEGRSEEKANLSAGLVSKLNSRLDVSNILGPRRFTSGGILVVRMANWKHRERPKMKEKSRKANLRTHQNYREPSPQNNQSPLRAHTSARKPASMEEHGKPWGSLKAKRPKHQIIPTHQKKAGQTWPDPKNMFNKNTMAFDR